MSGRKTFIKRRDTERDARLLERLQEALEEPIEIPEPIAEIKIIGPGHGPMLSVEALELARQVYYLRHGTIPDAAAAIIAADLTEATDRQIVVDRVRHLFDREGWPKRSRKASMAIRDASVGGLYRSDRRCIGVTTGMGPQPAGEECHQSPLRDSEYCFHHDPRPEYVEKRRLQALHLQAARRRDMVPLEPFIEWAKKRRVELLAKARESGEKVHHNDRGWGRLANALGIDQSMLHRLTINEGSRGVDKQTIRAATIVRYLENVDETFEDIYGFPPPSTKDHDSRICGGCGNEKSPGARMCWDCTVSLDTKQCAYVNRKNVRCPQRTRHETGYCYHCRKIVFHIAKTPKPKPAWLTDKMVLFALDEFRRHPSHAWVAAVLRAHDVDGIRHVYKNLAALTGSLVKYFAKRRWREPDDFKGAYAMLEEKIGVVKWDPPVAEFEVPGNLPCEPFNEFLVRFWASAPRRHGAFGEVAKELGIDAGDLSARVKGAGNRSRRSVGRVTVEKVLAAIDDGTTITDLYSGTAA